MNMRPGLVVTGVMLVLAMPAAARERHQEAGAASRLATTALPHHLSSRQTVELNTRDIVVDDPSGPRMFGHLPLADNASVGVGLFSVIGSTEKEQMRRRMDPSRAYRPADTRVAAVGFNLRF